MKAVDIVDLLKICLDKLNETGANVKLLTCDQGPNNQSAFVQLGVSEHKPYFIYNNKIYYTCFDFPHLIKRLTSFLRKYDKIYCDGQVIASYSDFINTWNVDNATKGGSNLLSHITEAHIRPNAFQAMNVKRAFQLFSHRFAAAIKVAGDGKEINSNTWKVTADFAENMNNIIDACNSYSLKITFGGKRPLSRKNPDIEILLTDFLQYCAKWSKSPDFLIQVPCFKGFVITIKSILHMYTELVNKYETFELATGLCNQDSVEHLFSKVRQRGGFNPNPTARMVRLFIRHILSTGYIQTTNKGNVQCEIENETFINRANEIIKTMENCLSTNNAIVTDENDLESNIEFLTNNQEFFEEWNDIEVEHINKLSNYDENAVTYFAG